MKLLLKLSAWLALLSVCILPPAVTAQPSGFIGTTSTATAASRGINRVVHIAARTDGRTGTGTAEDPYDGSTTAKFDTQLRAAIGSESLGTVENAGLTNVMVVLGPGIFTSAGCRGNGNTNELFRPLGSYIIRGQGRGITTIKLADSVAGSWTNAYIFWRGTAYGRLRHFELTDMTIDLNGANQSLVSGQGNADVGAVQVHCETGRIADVDVIDPYAKPGEYFPVFLGMSARTNVSTTVATNGVYHFERVRVWPKSNGGTTANMTVINMGDPGINSVWRPIYGSIVDCQVFGNAEELAFGGFSAGGVTLQNNWASNTWWGVVFDSYTNKNVRMIGNRFSRIAQTVASANGDDVEGFQFVGNTLDTPDGDGATVFTGDAVIDLVFGNRIDPAYTLNRTEHSVLRGWAGTNQFYLQGGTNLVIRDGALLTNVVLNAGSLAAPSISIAGDPNTGLASQGEDNISLVTGGAERLGANTSFITLGLPTYIPNGSAGVPAITTGSDTTTGLYRVGAGAWGFTSAGTSRVTFSSGGIAIQPLTNDRLVYTGVGNLLSTVTVGSGLTFSGGTLSASGGAITNTSSQIPGAGTAYSLTDSYARVDFGTTDAEVTLPEAGTYLVTALVECASDPMGDGLQLEAKLYNSSDAADVASSERFGGNSGGGSYDTVQTVLQNVVTVAASKTIQIYARDGQGTAEGSITAARTSISYIKLY